MTAEAMIRGMLRIMLLAVSPVSLFAQTTAHPSDVLLDVLVFGTHIRSDPTAYRTDLRAELERYLRRSQAYQSSRPTPSDPEMRMVHIARTSYERRLAAVSADSSAPSLARAYVESLRPCYEWEGYHDCPQREASFADAYLAAHPNSPFRDYLPLLAAHRWLCAAEGFDYEKQPADAAQSRRAYERRVVVARQSKDLLIRTAANRLEERGRCFASS
jgi:hypothetical protein